MHLGELDRPIVIEQATSSFDTSNYETKTWATYISPWAKRTYGSGGEGYEGEELVAEQSVDYTIRYDSGVTAKMRVNDGGKYYEILSIQYPDRDVWMVLKCKIKDSKMI